MALKFVLENLDEVDEGLRSHYAPADDGKFRLAVDGVEDTGALKRSLELAKKERNDAKALAAKYKDVDPDEYTRLKQEHEERELSSATKKGEYEKLKTQLVEKHTAELSLKDARERALRSTIDVLMIDSEAVRAIAAAKGVPELLLPHVRNFVRVVEEDGKFQVKVVDKDGDPRVGDKGEPMTIPQLVAEMRGSDIYGRAFDSSGASGGGAPSGRSTPTGQDLSKLAPVERMNAARAQQRK